LAYDALINFEINMARRRFKADGSVQFLPKTLSIKDVTGLLPKPQKAASLQEINEAASIAIANKYSR
jgi:hypothetical protein